MEDDFIQILGLIAYIVGMIALDIVIVSAVYYAICWCFGLVFSWKIALGIWILVIVFKNVIMDTRKDGKQ